MGFINETRPQTNNIKRRDQFRRTSQRKEIQYVGSAMCVVVSYLGVYRVRTGIVRIVNS